VFYGKFNHDVTDVLQCGVLSHLYVKKEAVPIPTITIPMCTMSN